MVAQGGNTAASVPQSPRLYPALGLLFMQGVSCFLHVFLLDSVGVISSSSIKDLIKWLPKKNEYISEHGLSF